MGRPTQSRSSALQLGLERGLVQHRAHRLGQAFEGRHQRLGDVAPAEGTEAAAFIRHAAIQQRAAAASPSRRNPMIQSQFSLPCEPGKCRPGARDEAPRSAQDPSCRDVPRRRLIRQPRMAAPARPPPPHSPAQGRRPAPARARRASSRATRQSASVPAPLRGPVEEHPAAAAAALRPAAASRHTGSAATPRGSARCRRNPPASVCSTSGPNSSKISASCARIRMQRHRDARHPAAAPSASSRPRPAPRAVPTARTRTRSRRRPASTAALTAAHPSCRRS